MSGALETTSSAGPQDVTRTFWLRHVATIDSTSPGHTSQYTLPASAWSASASVTVPQALNGTISGPDGIDATGTYEWETDAQGGPGNGYGYKWYYQKQGNPIQSVGADSTYSRYVEQTESFWFFRLIATVFDTTGTHKYWADSTDMMLVLVDPDFFGLVADTREPATAPGFVEADGTCTAVPEDKTARQALYRRLWDLPTITKCQATVTGPPRPRR